MEVGTIFGRVTNFFRADLSEIVGAYFDGEKIFVVRLGENSETVTVDADNSDVNHIAEKISLVCRQRAWKTHAVGFCLREGEAVAYRSEIGNIPVKEIPTFVQSWALAQAGKDAPAAFTMIGDEIWMETLPRKTLDEIRDAFGKFGLNLRAASMMPVDMLTKTEPIHHAQFIADVVRQGKAPNLLTARGDAIDYRKISAAIAAIFFVAIAVDAMILWRDYRAASDELDAAKISVDNLREDLTLKGSLDADIAELVRLNKLAGTQNISLTKFNLLLNLGRVTGGGVHLTKIRGDENSLEVEGLADTPDAVRNYLGRVKNSVVKSARLETSTERDDGDIAFTIRATLNAT